MKNENYIYGSKSEYCNYNREIIREERIKHLSEMETDSYKVNVQYYKPYRKYYIILPKRYLNNLNYLISNKNDIFSKRKILTFTSDSFMINKKYKRYFSFDAVVDGQQIDPYNNRITYAYLVPIKERYRYKFSWELTGYFEVKERNGELTYERMENALDDFENGECCSKNIRKYILGHEIKFKRNMNEIFNFGRYYPLFIRDYFHLNFYHRKQIDKILNNEMTTIKINSRTSHKLICLIIYAIYQMRKYPTDKILVCSASNSSADSIAIELLNMRNNIKKLGLLRIYAKNQEIITRPEVLNSITYHLLKMKEKNRNNNFGRRNSLIDENDVIISTCVNSYCDEIINYEFPYVILVDADNSNENENLIPLVLNSQHVVIIAYEDSKSDYNNLYKRMKSVYPENHINL